MSSILSKLSYLHFKHFDGTFLGCKQTSHCHFVNNTDCKKKKIQKLQESEDLKDQSPVNFHITVIENVP